jgi:hypothetical protein
MHLKLYASVCILLWCMLCCVMFYFLFFFLLFGNMYWIGFVFSVPFLFVVLPSVQMFIITIKITIFLCWMAVWMIIYSLLLYTGTYTSLCACLNHNIVYCQKTNTIIPFSNYTYLIDYWFKKYHWEEKIEKSKLSRIGIYFIFTLLFLWILVNTIFFKTHDFTAGLACDFFTYIYIYIYWNSVLSWCFFDSNKIKALLFRYYF